MSTATAESVTFSRRTLLGSMSAIAVATTTGCSLSGADPQDFGAGGGGNGLGLGAGDPAKAYVPVAPYAIQAECELTEDYFSVTNQPIDPTKDTVVAYSRADGEVEAIVLQGGVVRQYYRTASQPGGWGVQDLSDPDTPDVNAMVAGMSSVDNRGNQGNGSWLKVFWTRPKGKAPSDGTLYVAVEETPPATDGPAEAGLHPAAGVFATSTLAWGAKATDLTLTLNTDDSLLVSAMQTSTSSKGKLNADARLYFFSDGRSVDHDTGQGMPASGGYLTGFEYDPPRYPPPYDSALPKSPWSAVVARPRQGVANAYGLNTPTLMLYLPAESFEPHGHPSLVRIWAWGVRSGLGQVVTKVNLWTTDALPSPTAGDFLLALSIEGVTSMGGSNTPSMLVQTMSESVAHSDVEFRLWVGSHDSRTVTDTKDSWTWTELGSAVSSPRDWLRAFSIGLRPLDDSETAESADETVPKSYLDVFVVVNGTLTVFRQAPTGSAYADYSTPAYCPAIPLETGVSVMAGQAGQSSGDELLFVNGDGHLRTLTKSPRTGVWSDAAIQLPAGDLQELDSYRVQITLTDTSGYPLANAPLLVSAATPIVAMNENADGTSSTTTLTPSPTTFTTDPTGRLLLALVAEGVSAPTLTVEASDGTAVTVLPSAAVNTYFQGGAQLNYLDPIDQDGTLTAAQTPANTPVFPKASDKGAANDALATISKAATQATAGGLTAARRSSTLARRDGALRAGADKAAVQGLVSDINHWGHDALHAIKKGAAKIKAVTYDAEQKAFVLAGDFEGWADKTLSVIVQGIEDAAHVVHAAFNKLGAWIKDAIHWLKAEVIGTLKDTFKLAGQFRTWLVGVDGAHGLFPEMAAAIGKARSSADQWLSQSQQSITADFNTWRANIDPKSTMSSLASNAQQSTFGGRKSPKQLYSAADTGSHHHGMWLFNFSQWKINPAAGYNLDGIQADWLTSAEEAMVKALTTTTEDAMKAVNGFVSFLIDLVKHPKDVLALGEKALLDAVEGIIDWMFFIVKETIDTFLALAQGMLTAFSTLLFDTPLLSLPGLSQLLKLVGINVPSMGELVLAVLAFPAVVTYKIQHKGNGYPFASMSATAGRPQAGGDDVGSTLLSTAAGVSFLWAVVDALSSLYQATDEKPPKFIGCIDIAAPTILAVLTAPHVDGKPPFIFPPIDNRHLAGTASWGLGISDAVIAAADFYAEEKFEGREAKEKFGDTMLWLEFTAGAFDLVLGCVQTKLDNHEKGVGYVETVLDALPLLATPLLTDKFVVSSGGISAGVNAAMVAGAGIVSGILFAREG